MDFQGRETPEEGEVLDDINIYPGMHYALYDLNFFFC